MAVRMLEHLLSYGDPAVRAAVPLALALLRPSAPDTGAMDTLSRLSHDTDGGVAHAALLALGVLGAGTNNARLAGAALFPLPQRHHACAAQHGLQLLAACLLSAAGISCYMDLAQLNIRYKHARASSHNHICDAPPMQACCAA
jgi:hypothetical protein